MKRKSVRRLIFFLITDPTLVNTLTRYYEKHRKVWQHWRQKKTHVCIKQTKSDSYLTYNQSCKTLKLYPKKYYKETCMFYENVTWDGNIKKKLERYTNCKHCIAVDLILKHKQKG